MSGEAHPIALYILAADDGISTDEKLRLTAGKYAAASGMEVGALTVARTERGKPYFLDAPGLFASPSHSGDYFLCAVACGEVGADIQIHKGLRDETPEEAAARLQRIAGRYFSPAEAEYLKIDTCNRFFRLWTARESYVKLTGQGIDGSFAEHCVLPDGAEALPGLEADGQIVGWQALGVYFRQLRLPEGYTLCVCAREDFSLELHWMTK